MADRFYNTVMPMISLSNCLHWYQNTQKGLHHLLSVSLSCPKVCTNAALNENTSFTTLGEGSSVSSFLCYSFPKTVSTVMLMPVPLPCFFIPFFFFLSSFLTANCTNNHENATCCKTRHTVVVAWSTNSLTDHPLQYLPLGSVPYPILSVWYDL